MALWIDEIAAYAQTNAIGTIGTDLFRFALTESPDKQVALIPVGGASAQPAFGSDVIKWEFPRFQGLSRGDKNDPRPALQKAEDAYRVFAKISAETLSGTFYHHATCQQPPFSLGLDDNGRPMFAFNVQIEKELSA